MKKSLLVFVLSFFGMSLLAVAPIAEVQAGLARVWGTVPIKAFGSGGVKSMTGSSSTSSIHKSVKTISKVTVGGTPTPTVCPAGKYLPTGQKVCVDVGAGYFSPGGGIQRFQCLAGRYGNRTNNTTQDCDGACQIGYSCPTGSIIATAQSCPAGTYTGETGQATCSTCTADHYCPGGTDQVACDAGYISPAGSDAEVDCADCRPNSDR